MFSFFIFLFYQASNSRPTSSSSSRLHAVGINSNNNRSSSNINNHNLISTVNSSYESRNINNPLSTLTAPTPPTGLPPLSGKWTLPPVVRGPGLGGPSTPLQDFGYGFGSTGPFTAEHNPNTVLTTHLPSQSVSEQNTQNEIVARKQKKQKKQVVVQETKLE